MLRFEGHGAVTRRLPGLRVVPWADGARVTGSHVGLARRVVWIGGAGLGAAVVVVWSLGVKRLGLGGPGIMAAPGRHGVLRYLQRSSSSRDK